MSEKREHIKCQKTLFLKQRKIRNIVLFRSNIVFKSLYFQGAIERFHDNVQNDPGNAIDQTMTDLGKALGIANQLVMNDVITVEQGLF